jgi:hypothetical protein
MSSPISSSVSYRFGDDGQGNIAFPAITICLDNFQILGQRESVKRCPVRITYFETLLKWCVGVTSEGFTTNNGEFGNMFDYGYDDSSDLFATVDEAIEAVRLNVNDMIAEFSFGREIIITEDLSYEYKVNFLSSIWTETIHNTDGFCFTFDPKLINASLMPTIQPSLIGGGKTLLAINIVFQVSCCPTLNTQLFFHIIFFQFTKILDILPNQEFISGANALGYLVYVHESIHNRFDAPLKNPSAVIRPNKHLLMKIQKTHINAISSVKSPCINEDYYDALRCQTLLVI